MIKSAFTSGTWGGSGISSADANSTNRALGYAEASAVSISTFSGVSVDSTSVLIGYTYYGDANLDGEADFSDFSTLSTNFNTTNKIWQDGDSNYDGSVNIGDMSLLTSSTNYQQGTDLLRPGQHPLQEVYVAMLDHAAMYWEAKLWPALWERFEMFESMNLGPVPPMPAYLLGRNVPEPVSFAVVSVAVMWIATRRRAAR